MNPTQKLLVTYFFVIYYYTTNRIQPTNVFISSITLAHRYTQGAIRQDAANRLCGPISQCLRTHLTNYICMRAGNDVCIPTPYIKRLLRAIK